MDCERSSLISGNTEYGTPPSTSPLLNVPVVPSFADASRNEEGHPSSFHSADRQVAGYSVEGFHNRVPDRQNFNYIYPNPRPIHVNSSANSTADGLDAGHHQSLEPNGPAYYNRPRFALNTEFNDIDQ